MRSQKLEHFLKRSPSLSPLIVRLEKYLESQQERNINEIVPRVAASELGISEADVLGLLTVFEDAGLVKPKYDLICKNTDGFLGSVDSLDELPDEIYCRYEGQMHLGDDLTIQLVFEIVKQHTSDAAA